MHEFDLAEQRRAAILLGRLTRLSTIIGVTTLGIIVASAWSPIAESVSHTMEPIESSR